MHKTIVIMIDAFRKNYLSPETMPYLYSLSQKYLAKDLDQSFGFRASMDLFLGQDVKTHHHIAAYGLDKSRKGELSHIPKFILKNLPKSFIFNVTNLSNFYSNNDMLMPRISPEYLKYFSRKQKKHFYQKDSTSTKNIFDLLRENKTKFIFYDWPLLMTSESRRLDFNLKNDDAARVSKFLSLIKEEYQFYYLHIWDLDTLGHKYGPDSLEMKTFLKREDDYIKQILSKFDLQNDNIILVSDNGMVNVKDTLNLNSLLPKFGEGYYYFLDSTMARFWFTDSNKKKEVLEILSHTPKGHLLSDKEKENFGFDSSDDFYGEEIFLLDSGVLLLPNFFQQEKLKGMHGYDLSDGNEKAFILSNVSTKKKMKTSDVFQLILDSLTLR